MPVAVPALAAVTTSPATAPRTDTDSMMASGLWKPETLQWGAAAGGGADVALVQQLESAACGGAPAGLTAAHEWGSGHGHSALAIVRKCFELASAEQALAVHAGVHAGPAAELAAVLAAVQVAALPAGLAADQQQLLVQWLCLQ